MSYRLNDENPLNRYLLSNNSLLPQELLFETEPIACTVLALSLQSICSFCFNDSKPLLACSGCLIRRYCNKDCQVSDWKTGHKYECSPLKRAKTPYFKPTSLFLLAIRLLATKELESKRLLSNIGKFPLEKLDFFKQMGFLLLKALEIAITEESIGNTIELLCRININAFTIHSPLDEPIGLGIYLPGSYLNHSCEPNCKIVFSGRKQRLFTMKSIAKDQELTISYVPKLDTQKNNHNFLLNNYFFQCKCTFIKEEDPRVLTVLELLGKESIGLEEKRSLWVELKGFKGLSKAFYVKALSELAYWTIFYKEYKQAYKYLKLYSELIGDDIVFEPENGWKYAELAKLARLLRKKPEIVFKYSEKAFFILRKYYKENDGIDGLKDVEIGLKEIRDAIRIKREG